MTAPRTQTLPSRRLQDLLRAQAIDHSVVFHPAAFTAKAIAAATRIPGLRFVKSVVVRLDGTPAMAVLPAPLDLNLDALAAAVGVDHVKLAGKLEFLHLFPDCDVGMAPPFGNLYGLQVYMSDVLTDARLLSFTAGHEEEVVTLGFDDYMRVVRPRVLSFTQPRVREPVEQTTASDA